MKNVKRRFFVTSSGQDEYPGDGLYLALSASNEERVLMSKKILDTMGLEVKEGDEVEVSARVISRVVTERRPV